MSTKETRMRRLAITSLLLALLTLLSFAAPPLPEDQGIIGRTVSSGSVNEKIFVTLVCPTGVPWDFGSIWATTVTPADSLSVANAARVQSAGTSVPSLYPVVRDRSGPAERWFWGEYDFDGRLVAAPGLVGFSPPPATANQLLPPPGSSAYVALQQEIENYWRDDNPTMVVSGTVEWSRVFLGLLGGQGFSYQGEPMTPEQTMMCYDSVVFGSSPPEQTPGGLVIYETAKQYYDRSFNGTISIVRGYGTDQPGVINHFVNGAPVPIIVPYTFQQMTQQSFGSIWSTIVPNALAEAGLVMPDPDPYHLVELVWLVDYSQTNNTPLWAMAYSGSGQFQTNAYLHGDVGPLGPAVHESAHACNSIGDQYYPWNYGFVGRWGVMASGTWNNNGWHVPAHLIPDAAYCWPGETADDISDVGSYTLGHRGYVRFRNPFSTEDSTLFEWLYLAALDVGREGLQLPGTKLLAIQTNGYEECGDFG